MKKFALIAAISAVAAASQAVVFTNVSLTQGGFTAGAFVAPPVFSGASYTATGVGLVLPPNTLGSSQWTFNFNAGAHQAITGYTVNIVVNAALANRITLTGLDVLNTSVAGSPNVFDLATNGGGAEAYRNASGLVSDVFPNSPAAPNTGGYFHLTSPVQVGRFSVDNLYTAGGTYTITVTPTVVPVPEPASLAVLGIGAVGLFARRRRK